MQKKFRKHPGEIACIIHYFVHLLYCLLRKFTREKIKPSVSQLLLPGLYLQKIGNIHSWKEEMSRRTWTEEKSPWANFKTISVQCTFSFSPLLSALAVLIRQFPSTILTSLPSIFNCNVSKVKLLLNSRRKSWVKTKLGLCLLLAVDLSALHQISQWFQCWTR